MHACMIIVRKHITVLHINASQCRISWWIRSIISSDTWRRGDLRKFSLETKMRKPIEQIQKPIEYVKQNHWSKTLVWQRLKPGTGIVSCSSATDDDTTSLQSIRSARSGVATAATASRSSEAFTNSCRHHDRIRLSKSHSSMHAYRESYMAWTYPTRHHTWSKYQHLHSWCFIYLYQVWVLTPTSLYIDRYDEQELKGKL